MASGFVLILQVGTINAFVTLYATSIVFGGDMIPSSVPIADSDRKASEKTLREEFLLKMYDQLMNDINRHLTVIWQPVAVIITTFAVLAVSKEISGDKGIVSLDYSVPLVVLICTWAAAHIIDASYWYNRNLVIIANIERQFLRASDVRDVHYYFAEHRPKNKMLSHLEIQLYLAIGVALVVLAFHFLTRARGACCSLSASIDWSIIFPYIVAMISLLYLNYSRNDATDKYLEFVKQSPGKDFSFAAVRHAVGHGTRRKIFKTICLAFRLRTRAS